MIQKTITVIKNILMIQKIYIIKIMLQQIYIIQLKIEDKIIIHLIIRIKITQFDKLVYDKKRKILNVTYQNLILVTLNKM